MGEAVVRSGARVVDHAALALVVDLANGPIERLPETEFADLLGVAVRRLRLAAFEASTPAKIRMALRALREHGAARTSLDSV